MQEETKSDGERKSKSAGEITKKEQKKKCWRTKKGKKLLEKE